MVEPLTDEEFEKENAILLPRWRDREWIIDELANLVDAHGYEHLVLAPLLEPTETYFPDPWRGGEESLRRLARRLLVYADLEEADVHVKVHPDDDVGGAVAPAGIGAAIWFVRRGADTLYLAARASTLKNPMVVVPATARAIAEGWRMWHGLSEKRKAIDEQRLVDLTAIFLGFGRLTTDAAVRHSAERTGGFRVTRTKTKLGVLKPQALSYALAVQMVARRAPPKQLRTISKALQANQAGFFKTALEAIARRKTDLADDLGLPDADAWDDPPDLEDLTAPLQTGSHTGVFRGRGEDPPEEAPVESDKGIVGANEGKPVFRVERSQAMRLAKMLGLPVVLLGLLAGRMQMGIDIEMWKIGLTALVLGSLGLGVGRLLPDARCSEPQCGTPLPKDAKVCPRCGGTIAGVIGHPKERLAAEEALLRGSDDDNDNESAGT